MNLAAQTGESRGQGRINLQESVIRGTRSLKESTRELHEWIAEKTIYTQKLEKAIADLQKSISSQPHPVLAKDFQIVPGFQYEARSGSYAGPYRLPDAEMDELVKEFGMASIENDGKAPFHGVTAASEFLLKESDGTQGCEPGSTDLLKRPISPLRLPPELVLFNIQFPCPPTNQVPPDMKWFLPCLPSYQTALRLIQNYLSYFSWIAMPVPQADLVRILGILYPRGIKAVSIDLSDAHGLAVLFMVFLLGKLYDPEIDDPSFHVEMEEYHSLARAAMAADPVTEHTTVHGVQAIILMIWYFRLFPKRRSLGYQWGLSGFLARLVQAIGLHRDSSERIQDVREQGRFKQIFWEFVGLDVWHSYILGRPTSMTNSMIDCKLPLRVDVAPGHDPDYYLWRYSYTRTVSDVMEKLVGEANDIGDTNNTAVVYSNILRHERSLKGHWIPPNLSWPEPGIPLPRDEAVGKVFQRFLTTVWKRGLLMYLHRQYFWDAISKHGDNPSKSLYWHSVVALYESASGLVQSMRTLWLAHPRTVERMCPFWSHTHTAALLLGVLVVKSPGCQFAEEALRYFDETYQMFLEAKHSMQPYNARSTMLKLQRKAHDAFNRLRNPTEQMAIVPDTKGSVPSSSTQYRFTSAFEIRPPHLTDDGADSKEACGTSTPALPIKSQHTTSQFGDTQDVLYMSYPSQDRLFNGIPEEQPMEQQLTKSWDQIHI